MTNKFSVGDKVLITRVNKRTPKHIVEGLRLTRPRTIVATFYDKWTQHTRYYLGTNKRGDIDLSSIHFRASQLKFWIKGNTGRPKERRKYTKHTPLAKSHQKHCNAKIERQSSDVLP